MWSEQELDIKLTTPSDRLVKDMSGIQGDIIVLGAGGKMGPTLCVLAHNAMRAAGVSGKVTAVSRFTDPVAVELLRGSGVETISTDLLEPGACDALPDAPNVIYMAGRKFDTVGQEYLTWAMNARLPGIVAERYKNSRIVVFSSGNIYPMVSVFSGGATEQTTSSPVGEYGMSCLARERLFEYGSYKYGTPVLLYRLNYAVDLRYGVLFDIAHNITGGQPVSLATPCFNCIWQGDANEIAIRSLLHTASPAVKMNVTGPETVSVRYAATELGSLLGVEPVFTGEESAEAYLSNASKAAETFGYPSVPVSTLIKWQAEWILSGGRGLGKPTHFEERGGKY